ncbi:MAG: phosphoribosylaminoimidazolesuccinocarboxamide synthase [Armatimonadetes bacterium]|nr:phosphoribosylaminoimidazolesuccinocarboxamide synthase [Armatimonadota bacterium]
MTARTVSTTDLPFPVVTRGKVRDVYDLGDRLLLVASDRISAFDVILPSPIPDKGRVLTQISQFWFDLTAPLCPNQTLSGPDAEFPEEVKDREELHGRAVVVKKTQPFPVECVVRGYLSGSAWAAYRQAASANGIVELWGLRLPAGLRDSDRLPEPVFTPTTKAHSGHDESITFEEMAGTVGNETAGLLRDRALAVYEAGCRHAESRGLIVADTKFEFGERDGEILLIDEALTPDSSRFWDARTYEPGRPQPSFDKQFVRDWLQDLADREEWNKESPGPELPEEIVRGTSERYREAYRRITGRELEAG